MDLFDRAKYIARFSKGVSPQSFALEAYKLAINKYAFPFEAFASMAFSA